MPGPDTYIEQVRVQHPVGHGFFHSATLRSKVRRFDYIVDCGGASSALTRQIQAFKEGRDDRPLDLLVVTHFHADHIGGLEALLSDLKVTAVAVPYLSPEEKLLCLAALSRKRRDAKDEQLVLRPREWAQERGAKTVYIVHGDADRPPEVCRRHPNRYEMGRATPRQRISAASGFSLHAVLAAQRSAWSLCAYAHHATRSAVHGRGAVGVPLFLPPKLKTETEY